MTPICRIQYLEISSKILLFIVVYEIKSRILWRSMGKVPFQSDRRSDVHQKNSARVFSEAGNPHRYFLSPSNRPRHFDRGDDASDEGASRRRSHKGRGFERGFRPDY